MALQRESQSQTIVYKDFMINCLDWFAVSYNTKEKIEKREVEDFSAYNIILLAITENYLLLIKDYAT